METKKLAMLLKTVKAGSLKKAAEELHYSQTGLIYMMNSLEQELGISLLSRSSKGVHLTADGEVLLPLIQDIVNSENMFLEAMEQLNKQRKHILRIGAYPIFACYCLPPVIRQFMEENPGMDVKIHVGTEDDIHKWLEEDVVDVGISARYDSGGNKHRWFPLMQDAVFAAFPERYPIAPDKQSITLHELKDYPMLYSTFNPANEEIERMCEEENQQKIVVSSKDGSALLCMVEEGMGVTFLSGLYMNECPATVRMLPLEPPVMREIGISTKMNAVLPALVRQFITYLQSIDWDVVKK